MLVGREREQAALAALLERARSGETVALVVRGEPGVGKTALLRRAIELAGDMTVVRATGVESEAELEYSGLLEVCRPLLAVLPALPPRQAAALGVALGLEDGESPDRFGVAAATLGLLAAAAEEAPVLVLVDDAQWLDGASADALLFAARRLLADRVAFLFTSREDGFEARGLDELRLHGLEPDAAAELVGRATNAPLSDEVLHTLLHATGGNPLALLELPARLTPSQLDGSEPLAGPLPVGAEIERAFAGRLGLLPEEARRALCVLAAEGSGELAPALAALATLDLDGDALRPAEDAGLVRFEAERFDFDHPLLRAVAYQARPPSERRAAHRALADALSAASTAERRAWHLAAAAVGADDLAADALAHAADAALERGGHIAASLALERSARLTSHAERRLERLTRAAESAWSGGDSRRAGELVEEALAGAPEELARARLLALAGRIEFQEGSQERARALFLESSALVEEHDPGEALRVLGLAVFTCHNEGRIAEAVELARQARALAPRAGEAGALQADYLLGRSLILEGSTVEAEPLLSDIVDRLAGESSRLVLARVATALAVLDRGPEAIEVAERVVQLAREEGPMVLVYGLALQGELMSRTGRWRTALAAAAEGVELARQLGQDNVLASIESYTADIYAAQGREDECRRMAAEALALFERSGGRGQAERIRCALGLLELGLDRVDEAIAHLRASSEAVAAMGVSDRDVAPEPDLVEALLWAGRDDDARAVHDAWLERGWPPVARWSRPLVARCRGLLAEPDAYAEPFEEALALQEETTDLFQLGRTHLAYGQRLRRTGERVTARRQLSSALEVFEELEAGPWAERARQELRASGAKLRRRAESGDELTPQELQIALQVAEGKQNKEVAAAMFLSPKTVEFHLSRIYRKLGITSRSELVRRFAAEASGVAA